MQPAAAATRQTLDAYDWNLFDAYDARNLIVSGFPLQSKQPRLQFHGDRLAVVNLCNAFSAPYRLNGENIQISPGIMTKRLCADTTLMAQETHVADQLPRAERLLVQRGVAATTTPQMTLYFADGTRWELWGEPTPATRYGSPGERVFLEVAPQLTPCNSPTVPGAQCLRVRELRYDDRGLRQGAAGEWRALQGGIQGFTHEPGFRKVLRVQRYPYTPPGQPVPADAPSHVHVLDMVTETELAQ
jgi:heat shock protein HslJ